MSFTFNNRNCETFGLAVEKYPPRQTPEKRYNTYEVPGLSGKVFIPQGGYSNVTQTYEVFVKKGAKSIQQLISEIAAWLLTPDEPKDLYDTYDTDTVRKAVFLGGNEWANSLNKYGSCMLEFDCAPQRYDKTPQIQSGDFPGGSVEGFIIGTGSPKGNGYIDDIIPLIELWATSWSTPSGEVITVQITNPITSEVTTIVLTCTTAYTDKKLVIDMLKGIMYIEHKTTQVKEDVLTYFTVSMTGTLKRRFTYRCDVDMQVQIENSHFRADPRWYKL